VDAVLLGSTTDRVVRKSRCPVMAVGPKPSEAAAEMTPEAAEEEEQA
jgi:hypothetical protein